MATRPSGPLSWATDTNYTSGPDAGAATKVEPSTGYKAQGQVPGNIFGSQYYNWILNLIGQWTAFLGETGISRTVVVPASDMILGQDPSTGAARWITEGSGAFGNAPRHRPIVDDADAWAILRVGIIPAGSTLTKIEILVNCDTARATATDRWNVRAFRRAWDWTPSISAPTMTELGSIQNDGGGSGLQLITFSGLSEAITADDDFPIWIEAPASVGADHLLAVRASFTTARVPD